MLPNHIALYVPSNASGERLPADVVRTALGWATRRFISEFHGCTVRPAVGHWRSDSGVVVVERIRTVEAYSDRRPSELNRIGESLATELAAALSQECVAYVVNGTMRFAGVNVGASA